MNYKGINIYYIGYITIKKIDDCESIYWWTDISGYIDGENGNKYLIFDDSVDENKELLKKYPYVWDGIKNNDYGKDYMKTKFNSDDDLPLNKLLKLHAMTMILRPVFEEDGKLYPLFLDDTLYECTYKC